MLGLIQEIGPFTIPDGGTNFTSTFNNFGWNKISNMLYFESPPGVGFSKNEESLAYNDSLVADENYIALQVWFDKFKPYQNRSFWITGESYAGMYIPYLAYKIDEQNANPQNIYINLTGNIS